MGYSYRSWHEFTPLCWGSLASIYASNRDKKKFERIEAFFNDVFKTMEELKQSQQINEKNLNLSKHDEEALASLIESILDKVESEIQEDKKRYLRNFFLNSLVIPTTKDTIDKKQIYLDALANMSYLECELLIMLYGQKEKLHMSQIEMKSADQYFILSLTNRLRNYGFVEKYTNNITANQSVDNALDEFISISNLGKDFTLYCLET
ncbi:hypothetical protein JCM19046_3508 [Bacillus sp. JCM 19046]|nr:hypothetical protein JCM19045_4269 [Bacillus sp. JCM 19045]GAF18897.1 hypothetical protein JCM19046_3508 [Bacillus sp. JCM 19046]